MLLEVNTPFDGSVGLSLHKLSPIIVQGTLAIAILKGNVLWVLADVDVDVRKLYSLQGSHSYQHVAPMQNSKHIVSPDYIAGNVIRSLSPDEVYKVKSTENIYLN